MVTLCRVDGQRRGRFARRDRPEDGGTADGSAHTSAGSHSRDDHTLPSGGLCEALHRSRAAWLFSCQQRSCDFPPVGPEGRTTYDSLPGLPVYLNEKLNHSLYRENTDAAFLQNDAESLKLAINSE